MAFPPQLRHGDIALTRNPQSLGRIICAVQAFHDPDGQSKYSHSLIITDPTFFKTIEARNRIWHYDMEEYAGDDVLIARHESMSAEKHYQEGLVAISKHMGQRYPWYRIFFHLLGPGFSKWSFGYVVCSELVAKYLCGCGIFSRWKGYNPGHLENIFRNYPGWTVWEGKWPEG